MPREQSFSQPNLQIQEVLPSLGQEEEPSSTGRMWPQWTPAPQGGPLFSNFPQSPPLPFVSLTLCGGWHQSSTPAPREFTAMP